MYSKTRYRLVVTLILLLVTAVGLPAMAVQGEGEVEVRARVGGQIQLIIESGEVITFDVDPVINPEDTAETELLVMTNAPEYSITANFSKFLIEDWDYDLIANEKFFIRSQAPGSGQALEDWAVPEKKVVILSYEDGLTPGESTLVEYLLQVDFTVPPGEGTLSIVFTAMASF